MKKKSLRRPEWFLESRRKHGKASQKFEATFIGNQIIFQLSHDSLKYDNYFIVKDAKTGWRYLVWDLNRKGGPMFGKFKQPRKR